MVSVKSGRKADVATDYCSLIQLLGLLTYRMELKTFKMEGSSPHALKQGLETEPYGETTLHARFTAYKLEEESRVECLHNLKH